MQKLSKNSPKKSKLPKIKLVIAHGKDLATTSLIVADLFGRPHKNVVRSLKSLSKRGKIGSLVSASFTYFDSQNREQTAYELSERDFLIAMPFIGGEKSEDGQVALVDEFLRLHKLQNQAGRKEALQYKRDTAKPMTDMLTFIRETVGKKTSGVPHCTNEHLFCNRALNGKYEPIDEDIDLDGYDAKLLGLIRQHNTLLMTRFLKQADRKPLLDKFVEEYRTKNPRDNLIQEPRATYQVRLN